MAKVQFKEIVEAAHGKVEGSSNVSYRKSYGCNHTYTWSKDNKVRQTPLRHLQREVMRLANIEASSILSNPEQTALWNERFKAQSQYRYFRPYIVAMKMAELKEAIGQEGDKARKETGQV